MLEGGCKVALKSSGCSRAGYVAGAMWFTLCETEDLSCPSSKYMTSIKEKMLDLTQFSFILSQLKQLLEI